MMLEEKIANVETFYGQPDILGSMFHVESGRNMLDMDFAYLRSHCFALDCRKEETMQKDRVIFVSSFNHCEKFLHFLISIVTGYSLQSISIIYLIIDHLLAPAKTVNCQKNHLIANFYIVFEKHDQNETRVR